MSLTTLGVTIDATGISAPSFAEILGQLQENMRGIYGSDIILTPDSQDGQLLAVFASAINDTNQAAIAVYNSYSPTFAIGAGLSSVVKINGISRMVPSNSTVAVTIVGVAGTVITNGIVGDANKNLWNLPATVTIPLTGTIIVTATAQKLGAITAPPGSVTGIYTPTRGWQSVTNAGAAVLGAAVETDAALRQRQTLSTALPSQTTLDGIFAAVASVPGVQRSTVYENDTEVTDANGLLAHSIAAVVLGGDTQAVAQAIASKKPPGIQTQGTISEIVVDPLGLSSTINFYPLTQVPLTVSIVIKALPGYSSNTVPFIAASVAQFINALSIGEFSYVNRLFAPANLEGDAATLSTGFPQSQLTSLSNTYNVLGIMQSRGTNPVDTTVVAGPYTSNTMNVANAIDLYPTCSIGIVLDDASTLVTTVQSVAGSLVTFLPAVPGGRSILTGANVYLLSDLKMLFNEAASLSAADVTVTVVA